MKNYISILLILLVSSSLVGQKVKYKKDAASIDGVHSYNVIKGEKPGESGVKPSYIKNLMGKTIISADQINIQTIVDNKFYKVSRPDSNQEYFLERSFFYTGKSFAKKLVAAGVIKKGGEVDWGKFDSYLAENDQSENCKTLRDEKVQLTLNQDYKYPINRTKDHAILIEKNGKGKAILTQEGRPFAIYEVFSVGASTKVAAIKNLRGALIGTAESDGVVSLENHVNGKNGHIFREDFGSDAFIKKMAAELIEDGFL